MSATYELSLGDVVELTKGSREDEGSESRERVAKEEEPSRFCREQKRDQSSPKSLLEVVVDSRTDPARS